MTDRDYKSIIENLGIDLDKTVNIVNGEDITIITQGESKDFGGLDLQLRAAIQLINSFDFKFQEEDDPEIRDKTYLALIDVIGTAIKSYWLDPSAKNKTNIQVVQDFIGYFIEENTHKSH